MFHFLTGRVFWIWLLARWVMWATVLCFFLARQGRTEPGLKLPFDKEFRTESKQKEFPSVQLWLVWWLARIIPRFSKYARFSWATTIQQVKAAIQQLKSPDSANEKPRFSNKTSRFNKIEPRFNKNNQAIQQKKLVIQPANKNRAIQPWNFYKTVTKNMMSKRSHPVWSMRTKS